MKLGELRARRRDDGAAAVEFALVVPFLLLILFGIISYGVMLSFRQTLSQAAAEGARASAVTFQADEKRANGQEAVGQAMDSFGISCSGGNLLKAGVAGTVGTCDVTEPGECSPATAGVQCVTVTLTYEYGDHPIVPSFPLVGAVIPSELTYSAQARVS